MIDSRPPMGGMSPYGAPIGAPTPPAPILVIDALKRDRARLPRLRVLAYSRHVDRDDDDRALAAGCGAVLHKSAPSSDLLSEVNRLDGRVQARSG